MRARAAGWLVLVLMGACDGATDAEGRPLAAVRVSAAASLTDAFGELVTAFERATPGAFVVLNLAGSSALREQILAGAPVDVFASASSANMQRLVEAGKVSGEPGSFVRNRLQIAVPSGNPAEVTGLADLAREGLLIGLCAEGVPCGDFARQALERAGVTPSPDTYEPNVRALLTKVAAGELDAGIVYASEVGSSDGVDGVTIPEQHNVVAAYPIAVLADAPNSEGAASFVAYVLSDAGRAILLRHGFAAP